MAKEQVSQKNIISEISKKLYQEFKCKIWSDEVKRGFDKPCFFIKFVNTFDPQSIYFSKNTLSVILTYFPDDDDRNEIIYLDIVDRIKKLFPIGIAVKDRYLHIQNITDTRMGEDADILQVTLDIEYLDFIERPENTTEIAGDLDINIGIERRK